MNTADLNRRIESIIRLGTIAEVDHAARKLRVKTGDLLTDWLPWPAEVGRNFIRWRPLRPGTQVILSSPSGDPAQATVIGMLYTQALPSPSTDPDLDLIQFDDGSLVEYHSGIHQLRAQVASTTLTMNRAAMTLTSNGSTIVLDGQGILINGNRVDIN
jgi:phage baseplate assembly protein V